MTPLPAILSPCSNVRRSCEMLVKSAPYTKNGGGSRTVSINDCKLYRFGQTIGELVKSHPRDQNRSFVEWDENGWHYTGSSYFRRDISNDTIEEMRMERVALYVLALDAINFCFWPSSTDDDGDDDNLLGYEHLAIALKRIAEVDDEIPRTDTSALKQIDNCSRIPITAEDTYHLSPLNLSNLTPTAFHSLLYPHLPSKNRHLPNLQQRCYLLNELGSALLYHHSGSALHMIRKANQSADTLVSILVDTFSGFRDVAVDDRGNLIYFYKRAQIAVADLGASLKRLPPFDDMRKLTTFPDYRIPQLLRHEGILVYEDELAAKVDSGVELKAGCMEELHIRAGTVVAVDRLVDVVKTMVGCDCDEVGNDLTAVKLDWYLWQVGEKMDRDGKMKKHHRVRTVFY